MFETTAVIKNQAGIHCRPSAILVKEGCSYDGKILIRAPSGTCDLTSALECIMLGMEQGTQLTVQVTGPDEEAYAKKLADLLETHFDFPPQ